jgi:cobalamin biosynthesis Mg chelatase CobN
MQTSTGSIPNHTSTANPKAYSPSVPLSVYRDLAGELQAAEAMLNAFTAQNKQLVQENQLLRQEIAKVVQSFSHLQNLVDTSATANHNQIPRASGDLKSQTSHPVNQVRQQQRVSRLYSPVVPENVRDGFYSSHFSSPVVETIPPIPEPVFIEEEEVRYYPHSEQKPKEVSAWSLVIGILLIILTAFGVGYVIVRPFFEHQSR